MSPEEQPLRTSFISRPGHTLAVPPLNLRRFVEFLAKCQPDALEVPAWASPLLFCFSAASELISLSTFD